MNGFETVAGVAAARALNALPAGVLMTLLAWMLQRVLHKQSASVRFSIWFVALIGIAGFPLLPRFEAAAHISGNNFSAGITFPNSWAVAILATWGAIAFFGGVRLLFGLWKLHQLKSNSRPADISNLPAQLRQTIVYCNSIRRVELCISDDVRVPTAIGFLRPAILFPQWTWNELSAEDLRAVILHEFAHLERRDDWTNLAQKFIAALFFFHPAIWWIDRRLAVEREMACDELVLNQTRNRKAYASCLLSLAEKGLVRRGVSMAQAAVSHARDLSLRLANILAAERPLRNRVWKPSLVLAGLGVLILAAAVSGTPELVSFQAPRQSYAIPSPAVFHAAASSGVHIIPAKGRSLSQPISKAEVKQAKLSPGRGARAHALPAVQRQIQPDKPQVVRTATREASLAPQFLLLTQSTHVDDFGDARISFTLWRVTLPQGKGGMPQAEVIARSL